MYKFEVLRLKGCMYIFFPKNGTEDTALHSAAQFGHSLVVAVLLEVCI